VHVEGASTGGTIRFMGLGRWQKGSVGFASLAIAVGTVVAPIAAHASSPRVSGANEFDEPTGLAIGGGHLWVANEAGDSVTEINPSNGAWITTIARAKGYRFNRPVAITRNGADLFVANAGDSVTEITASSGKLVRVISGARFHFVNPVAVTSTGTTMLVLNAGTATAPSGSITEFSARTGAFLRRVSGAKFDFDNPQALTVSGANVFVADEGNSSVTEVRVANGALVRVIAAQGLDAPDGIAVSSGNVWVADSASNAATDINASTGAVIATYSDSDGDYGFGQPSAVIAAQGNVYIMTPYSTSPMVTKVGATNGTPYWYMCNTNGPYYFSDLSAFAVSGNDLWVASRTGDNSQTPGAKTGALTEMTITDGSLIATYPSPNASSPTTTSTSTTTTTP
jgi:hypothetical protein